MTTPLVAVSIAGTDSGGAAGVAADLATFAALGAHGACVVTAVTAQDTTAVHALHPIPMEIVEAQLDAVLEDLPVAAVKTGLLGSPEVVRLVADRVAGMPTVVVDPVLRASTGAVFADKAIVAAYRDWLVPAATVITPNAAEARALLGQDTEPAELALALHELGPAVVLTGGPDPDTSETLCTDWVASRGEVVPLAHPAIDTRNDHGTGCTYSAALAIHLARDSSLLTAAARAAEFTTSRLVLSRRWELGEGRGPVAHVVPTHRNTQHPKPLHQGES